MFKLRETHYNAGIATTAPGNYREHRSCQEISLNYGKTGQVESLFPVFRSNLYA